MTKAKKAVVIDLELTEDEAKLIHAVLCEVRRTGMGELAANILGTLEVDAEIYSDDIETHWVDEALEVSAT